MPGTFSVADAVELAVVERSGFIESRHAGSAVVLSPDGEVLRALGDTRTPIFPRSCLKPFQAVAVMTSGVSLRGEDAAIATASHSGTARARRARARAPRARVAADVGTRLPAGCADRPGRARRARSASGGARERVYMNCSGKHAAMLLACVANDWPLEGYLDPEHPLQKRILDVVERFTGERPGGHGRRRLRRARARHQPARAGPRHPEDHDGGHRRRRSPSTARRPRSPRPRASTPGRSADPASPTPWRSSGSACSPRSAPRASWS